MLIIANIYIYIYIMAKSTKIESVQSSIWLLLADVTAVVPKGFLPFPFNPC